MSVRFNPYLILSGLCKRKLSAVEQEQLCSKMFTFTCVFVHCFLRGCEMFSQSLVSPQILLPHIVSPSTQKRVQKPTTNDVSYKASTGHSKGFSVIALVLKCPSAPPGWLKRSAESQHTMFHTPSSSVPCCSPALSLRTGCLLSSQCHCALCTRQWRTKTHSWLVYGPTSTNCCHFGYKLTHRIAEGLTKPWQKIFKYLSVLLLYSSVFSSVSIETFPKCQWKQKRHKTDMTNITFLD